MPDEQKKAGFARMFMEGLADNGPRAARVLLAPMHTQQEKRQEAREAKQDKLLDFRLAQATRADELGDRTLYQSRLKEAREHAQGIKRGELDAALQNALGPDAFARVGDNDKTFLMDGMADGVAADTAAVLWLRGQQDTARQYMREHGYRVESRDGREYLVSDDRQSEIELSWDNFDGVRDAAYASDAAEVAGRFQFLQAKRDLGRKVQADFAEEAVRGGLVPSYSAAMKTAGEIYASATQDEQQFHALRQGGQKLLSERDPDKQRRLMDELGLLLSATHWGETITVTQTDPDPRKITLEVDGKLYYLDQYVAEMAKEDRLQQRFSSTLAALHGGAAVRAAAKTPTIRSDGVGGYHIPTRDAAGNVVMKPVAVNKAPAGNPAQKRSLASFFNPGK